MARDLGRDRAVAEDGDRDGHAFASGFGRIDRPVRSLVGRAVQTRGSPLWPLALAGAATSLAASCCAVPLALVLAGISGAWMAHLRVMEPYSPLLLAVSVAALALSWKRVFRARNACSAVTGTCAPPAARVVVLFWAISALTAVVLAVPLVAPLFY